MSKFVLVLLGLGLGSATLYAISFQTSNTSSSSTKTDTNKTVIVTEKIPGMNCICKASDGCKSPMTAKYECSNTPVQNTSTSPVITPTQTNSVIVTEPIPGASCVCKASDGCKNLATRKYECTKGKNSTQVQEVYVTKCSCIQIQKDGTPKVDSTGNACKNLQTAILKCTPITK